MKAVLMGYHSKKSVMGRRKENRKGKAGDKVYLIQLSSWATLT